MQIYFIDDYDSQAAVCCNNENTLNADLVKELQDMLHRYNSYIVSFKTTLETIPPNTKDFKLINHANKKPANQHRGRYNIPTTNEVAILMVGEEFDKRDILLNGRDHTKHKIAETHRSYDGLQYPLILCRGEDGYSISIPQVNPVTRNQAIKTVSCMNFYAYHMMTRQNQFNMLHRSGMLQNQFWVDQYAKIETERLAFICFNQRQLRAANYIHLQDALRDDGNASNVGQLVILPSSFTGVPRYMHDRTQDAMTYVRNYGRPDLFITFTCNPN